LGEAEGWAFHPTQLVSDNAVVENDIDGLPIEPPLSGVAAGASIFPVPALLCCCLYQELHGTWRFTHLQAVHPLAAPLPKLK
jgi:hypothetical protein